MTQILKTRDMVTAMCFSLGVYAGWEWAKVTLIGIC